VYVPRAGGKSYLLWLRGATLVAQEFDPGTIKLTGEPRPVADPVAKIAGLGQMHVAASAGGALLYSASSTARQFTWLDRVGRPLGTLGEPGEHTTFRLSPDGHRVAASRDKLGGADLWLLEVERGVADRFTSNSTLINMFPVWSPNGRTIVFSSNSPRNLFRKESSGGGTEERVTQSPNVEFPTDWSRDGHCILYYEFTPGTGVDLWVLPLKLKGGVALDATPKPYLRTPFNEKEGRFSPESSPHWIAYQSDVTGRYEVYIQAFPEPHGQFQISTGGGQYPQWAAGGRELVYVSLDNKLMSVNLKMGTESVEPSTPRELFSLPTLDIGLSPYEATPDGQRFLVLATPGQAGQPLTVVLNWPALFRKETAAP
jgi:Tol biopolymer transport system component